MLCRERQTSHNPPRWQRHRPVAVLRFKGHTSGGRMLQWYWLRHPASRLCCQADSRPEDRGECVRGTVCTTQCEIIYVVGIILQLFLTVTLYSQTSQCRSLYKIISIPHSLLVVLLVTLWPIFDLLLQSSRTNHFSLLDDGSVPSFPCCQPLLPSVVRQHLTSTALSSVSPADVHLTS